MKEKAYHGNMLLKWYDGLPDEEKASLDGGTMADILWERRKYGVPEQPTLRQCMLEYDNRKRLV